MVVKIIAAFILHFQCVEKHFESFTHPGSSRARLRNCKWSGIPAEQSECKSGSIEAENLENNQRAGSKKSSVPSYEVITPNRGQWQSTEGFKVEHNLIRWVLTNFTWRTVWTMEREDLSTVIVQVRDSFGKKCMN